MVVSPVKVCTAVKVKLPTPALVRARAEVSLRMPLMVEAVKLVRLNVPSALIAAAVNSSVVMVMLFNAVLAPTAWAKVVSPVPWVLTCKS